MGHVAAIGRVELAFAGERSGRKGGGVLKGSEWWRARGFAAEVELLDAAGRPTREPGELVFMIQGRVFGASQTQHLDPDLAGIEEARKLARSRHDHVLYEIAVEDVGPGTSGGPVVHQERRAVLWGPYGIRSFITFHLWAWFVSATGTVTFGETDVELAWEDAPKDAQEVLG